MRRIPKIKARSVLASDDDLGYLGCLAVDGDRVIACGGSYGSPTILMSYDGGASYEPRPTPVTPGLRSLSIHDGTLHVVGESGMLAASVDAGLTWTQIPVDTQTCLFDLHRAVDGSWWIIGDDGVILRSTDGVSYHALETDWDTRLLAITSVDGTIHILGYDGTIRRWTGTALEPLALDAGGALTELIVTIAGTWLVIGDGGTVYRSTDRGKTFAKIAAPTRQDLEAIIETPHGIIAVGDEATLLYSDDDGKSFARVPNDMDGHLWSLAIAGDKLLVGGDDGAIWDLAISDKATMHAEDEPEEADEEEDDDEAAVEPVTFASVAEASARWIREGKAFADALNAYVRRVYAVGPNKAGDEPGETRADMADYVRQQVVELNAAGQHRRARELFPPAYEPFDHDSLGQSIDQLVYRSDGRLVARIGADVHVIEADRIVPVPELAFFGQSFDRRFVAKGYADRVVIHDGWDGRALRTLPHTLSDVKSMTVAPSGDAILTATEAGIYWLTESTKQRLMPDHDDESVSYPHAALSPNGRFVALGVQDSPHVLIDRRTGRRRSFDPVSSYPHFAAFHADRPDMVFSSCHAMYGSATLAVSLDAIVGEAKEPARVLDRRAWVHAVASAPFGYLLGDRSGYVWALDFAGKQQWYLFLGSTLTAMDVSPDGKRLAVGSHAGYVIEIDLQASGDPTLLTDGPVRELSRWVFWRGHLPMIW